MYRLVFIVLLFLFFLSKAGAQLSDEDVLRAIRHNDIIALKSHFKGKENPDRLYGNNRMSLLHYAARLNYPAIIEILLNAGASIDKLYKNDTPLMIASYFDNVDAAEFLIKKGAQVNLQNKSGVCAAILSAKGNHVSAASLLLQYGADFGLKDCTQNSAIDYAYKLQNIEVYKLLTELTANAYEKTHLPNYMDGPYVFRTDKSKAKAVWLFSDSVNAKVYMVDSIFDFDTDFKLTKRYGFPFDISLKSDKQEKIKDNFQGVQKIMAIGDLHGGFEHFSNFLKNNKIIDDDFHWTFGDGHLVLIGDIFDRGDKVTECFWLLYNLENEAERSNGKVHFVLGNHEYMQFLEDKRYLNPKYRDLCNRLKINYSEFYGANNELGNWLRNKNAVLRINNVLFVHGGLSTEAVSMKLDISTINKKIRSIINRKPPVPQGEIEAFIVGSTGPLWYRGYLKLDDSYYKVTGEKFDFDEQKLDEILKFYGVEKLVFANTNVKEIVPLYNNKLYGIDIPFMEKDVEFQGLYIDSEGVFRVKSDGTHELLK